MKDHELAFGQCPLSPTGDICHENCELFVMTEGCCSLRLIAYKLAKLSDSLATIVEIFRYQAESE